MAWDQSNDSTEMHFAVNNAMKYKIDLINVSQYNPERLSVIIEKKR